MRTARSGAAAPAQAASDWARCARRAAGLHPHKINIVPPLHPHKIIIKHFHSFSESYLRPPLTPRRPPLTPRRRRRIES